MAVQIKERNVPGSVAELGVYKGAFAAELNRVFPERKIFLFDTFSGFDSRDRGNAVPKMDFSDKRIELVKGILPYPSQAVFIAGRFPDSLTLYQNLPDNYAIISLDADLYNPTLAGLEYFWPRLSTGGAILIHDYTGTQFPGVRQAVDEFCGKSGLFLVPLMDLHGTAVLIRQGN